MTYGNIRSQDERERLTTRGLKWANVLPRGKCKGLIRTAHKTYEAADRAAKNKDWAIVEIVMGDSF